MILLRSRYFCYVALLSELVMCNPGGGQERRANGVPPSPTLSNLGWETCSVHSSHYSKRRDAVRSGQRMEDEGGKQETPYLYSVSTFFTGASDGECYASARFWWTMARWLSFSTTTHSSLSNTSLCQPEHGLHS